MTKVLMCGDINVDIIMGGMASLPVVDREVMCDSYELTVGSSCAICACNYAALGGDVTFAGLSGNDDHGDFMIRGMHEFGIKTDLVRRTTEVRTGVTVNLIHGSTRTQVTYPGTISAFDGSWIDGTALGAFDHIHFAGPYLQDNFRGKIRLVLETARQLGLTTSLDPQWDGTEKWEHMDGWLPLLDYFFLNEDEALSITRCQSIESACRVLAEKTALPLLKAGTKGVYYLDGDKLEHVPALKVSVSDTTGAGDAFDSGFMFATFEKQMERREAVAFGVAAAARSCMFPGGVNARSSYEDVLELQAQA